MPKRAVVVGTGTIGSAVSKLLKQHAHQVVTVCRESGDFQTDKNTDTRFPSARLVGNPEVIVQLPKDGILGMWDWPEMPVSENPTSQELTPAGWPQYSRFNN